MTKPAGQEAHATNVPPAAAAGSDPFGLAPWLREMPGVSMHPLMANPMAAMAATTAIGFSIAGQMAGLMLGAMQGAAGRTRAAADEVAAVLADAAVAERPQETTANAPPAAQPEQRADAGLAKPKAVSRSKAAPVVAKKTEPAEKPAKAAPARKATRARTAKADDLKVISGVGPKLEQVLNGMGVTRYADIAAWSASDVARIEAELGLDGRIARDGWAEQAKGLAKG
jgi:NADH-quinone oxidoreductase subunit E